MNQEFFELYQEEYRPDYQQQAEEEAHFFFVMAELEDLLMTDPKLTTSYIRKILKKHATPGIQEIVF